VRSAGRLDFEAAEPDARFDLATKYRSAERPRQQGQMLGVLLGRRGGEHLVLKAFSGQLNNVWEVPGWAPPLGTIRHDSSPVYTAAFRRIQHLGAEAQAAGAEAAAGSRAEQRAAEARRLRARSAQRAISNALLARIWDGYAVTSVGGRQAKLLEASLLGAGSRGGTGDCCAPKLLAAARAQGVVPEAMAETWLGSSTPDGQRVEGAFYEACQERCAPLLGFMLCPVPTIT